MKKLSILYLINLLSISHFFYCNTTVDSKPTIGLKEIKANSFMLVNINSGKVILEKNSNVLYPMASITKLGTALVSKSEGIFLDDYITAPASAIVRNDYESRAGLEEKREYRYIDLLHAMLIPSGNDAARTIAYKINKPNSTFKNEIEKWILENHIQDFIFEEPVGTSSNSKTTAKALMKILELVKEDLDIYNILQKQKYTFSSKNNKEYTVITRTPISTWKDFKIFGKTGKTKKAGLCFAGFITKKTEIWKVAILGSDSLEEDLINIVEYIHKDFL
jgi:serine-type D-Ala-D-Ala carboxypeptidase (penicillin-binding protein 5/6)